MTTHTSNECTVINNNGTITATVRWCTLHECYKEGNTGGLGLEDADVGHLFCCYLQFLMNFKTEVGCSQNFPLKSEVQVREAKTRDQNLSARRQRRVYARPVGSQSTKVTS
jgi:hypothetical protein